MWRVETIKPKKSQLPWGYVVHHSNGMRLPMGWSAKNARAVCRQLNTQAIDPDQLPVLERA